MHDFDAGGLLVETDVAGKNPSPCVVIIQVKKGKWVRVDPTKKGTFDCAARRPSPSSSSTRRRVPAVGLTLRC